MTDVSGPIPGHETGLIPGHCEECYWSNACFIMRDVSGLIPGSVSKFLVTVINVCGLMNDLS